MAQYKIAVVVGSLRKDSFNLQLAKAMSKLAHPDFTFAFSKIDDLPLYNQDDDANQAASVTRLKGEIESAQGVIFFTPEYNRSMPGVLKNAIDHASRPWGKSSWGGKPAGVVGITVGAVGTAVAQQHLRNVLTFLNMPTLNQPELFLQIKEGFFDAQGEIGNADTKKLLQKWVDTYMEWVKKHA